MVTVKIILFFFKEKTFQKKMISVAEMPVWKNPNMLAAPV